MSGKRQRFKVLISGKKDFVADVRKYFIEPEFLHLQFVSSPQFIQGRTLFTKPDVIIVEMSTDTRQFRQAIHNLITADTEALIIVLSHIVDVRTVIEILKMGTNEYFIYPNESEKISICLTQIYNNWKNKIRKAAFNSFQERMYDFSQIVGNSEPILELLRRAKKLIESNARTVLIVGETGTGKELLARAVHYNSVNSNNPFVDIGCSTIPENLLESELFGHERGAFTDARDKKYGLFELANEGTIFLDEIGDISPSIQSKLLKVIEGRVMRRIGGTRDIPVKARIIAATSVNLESKVASGEFRRDLYHRLKILPLELPALRERREDIPFLVEAFIRQYNELYNKNIKGISENALGVLLGQEWQGNVRELKHAIERAVLLCEGDTLDINDFEYHFKTSTYRQAIPKTSELEKENYPDKFESITLNFTLDAISIDNIQKKVIATVLEAVGGNKSKAATLLKISRPRLDRLIKK